MPQRSVATNYTFEQQRTEINLLAADFWSHKTAVDGASTTYLKHDGSNDFTGGTLAVPNAFTINSNSGNGTVTIAGNLQVNATTTTVNTATMDVVDKNITIAKGSANDAAADGAGITIDSATDITLNFVDNNDAWVSSIGLEATTFLKGPYGQFTGSGTPTTGQGVEVNAPDGNTGQVISYDRTNSAYKELRLKGSSVGVYTGTTNALRASFNSNGLEVEAGDLKINNDTGKVTIGQSEDLQLYHDGGTSVIQNINNNSNLELQSTSTGKKAIRCYPNAGVTLYWNDQTTLYTTEDANNAGTPTIRVHDDIKLKFGNASDFEIYHSAGGHSYIENGTGTLYIRAKTGENSILAYPDGEVKLAWDDNTRFETTEQGVRVTGKDSTSSYATTDGGLTLAHSISSTGTSASQSVGIQFSLNKSGQTGAISEIGSVREGNGLSGLVFRTRDNVSGVNERFRIGSTGNTTFTGTGGQVHTFTSDSYNVLDIIADSDNDEGNSDNIIRFRHGSGGSLSERAEIRYDESDSRLELSAGDNQNHLVIKSDGFVGVGVNPTAKFHVSSAYNETPVKIAGGAHNGYSSPLQVLASNGDMRLEVSADAGVQFTRGPVGGAEHVSNTPDMWQKIGVWKGAFVDGAARCKITVMGTDTHDSNANVAGETIIYLAFGANHVLKGYFYSTSGQYPGLAGVAHKYDATDSSNMKVEIWVKYDSAYGMTQCYADCSTGLFEGANINTGLTTVPTGATEIESYFTIRTAESGSSHERLRINPNGNIGINSTGPESSLHVENKSTGTTEANKRIAGFYKPSASSASDREGYIHLGSWSGHYGVKLGYYNEGASPGYHNTGFFISTVNDNENITNHTKKLIVKSNGSVLVGTENDHDRDFVVNTGGASCAYFGMTGTNSGKPWVHGSKPLLSVGTDGTGWPGDTSTHPNKLVNIGIGGGGAGSSATIEHSHFAIQLNGTILSQHGIQSGGNATGGYRFTSQYSGKGYEIATQYADFNNNGSNGLDATFMGWWGSQNTFRVNTNGQVKFGNYLNGAVQSGNFSISHSGTTKTIRISGLVSGSVMFQWGTYSSAGQGQAGKCLVISGYQTANHCFDVVELQSWDGNTMSIGGVSKGGTYCEFTITNNHGSYTAGSNWHIWGNDEVTVTII